MTTKPERRTWSIEGELATFKSDSDKAGKSSTQTYPGFKAASVIGIFDILWLNGIWVVGNMEK